MQNTINGHARRGTGILNNELYIGQRVWNRLEYRKDPATSKRVSRLRPEGEWVRQEAPELRIVPQELWDAVKEGDRPGGSPGSAGTGGARRGSTAQVSAVGAALLQPVRRRPDRRRLRPLQELLLRERQAERPRGLQGQAGPIEDRGGDAGAGGPPLCADDG